MKKLLCERAKNAPKMPLLRVELGGVIPDHVSAMMAAMSHFSVVLFRALGEITDEFANMVIRFLRSHGQ